MAKKIHAVVPALVVGIGLAACSSAQTAMRDAESAKLGQVQAAVQLGASVHDVTGMNFKVLPAGQGCGGEPVAHT